MQFLSTKDFKNFSPHHLKDHTEGINCEKCSLGYYRPFSTPLNATNTCARCQCASERSTGNCAQYTGQCECKPEFAGLTCDRCADGFTGWPHCIPCTCNRAGSESDACFAPCRCKFGYLGPNCDRWVTFWGFWVLTYQGSVIGSL